MRRSSGRLAELVACAAAVLVPAAAHAAALPPVRHVFVVVLENERAARTFGPSAPAPYLARTLTAAGAFVPRYYATGHGSLDDYIAMISGQAANLLTQADCPIFVDFLLPGTIDRAGQQTGLGCVYPARVPTIAAQLQAAGLTWRAYAQSMGADPSREPAVCGHPALNSRDVTQTATAQDQFAARHVPFLYFHAIIDDTTLCDTHVVNLDSLAGDLASPSSTPNYAFITPDLCDDGHDATCPDPSRPGGYAGIDRFLTTWVPRITSSPAFKRDGLLMILFDESDSRDVAACCGAVPGPGSPLPGIIGPGGGITGAVLLSPFIAPGTVTQVPYNHFTMLRSVEDLFGLGHLGAAARAGGASFGDDVFTRPLGTPPAACVARALPRAVAGRLPAGALVQRVRLRRVEGRATIALRAVHAARLRIRVQPRGGPRRALVSRHVRACHGYRVALPRGHGVATVVASVRRGAQTTARRY
jgi:hypothetical protein